VLQQVVLRSPFCHVAQMVVDWWVERAITPGSFALPGHGLTIIDAEASRR
jgi:hypothetical protein